MMSAKPKHEVLQQFTAVLAEHNLMKLDRKNKSEYEVEALSILSRFTEAGLHLNDLDAAAISSLAVTIVKRSFEFWFTEPMTVDLEPIATELLKIHIEAYSEKKKKPAKKKEVKTAVSA